MQKNIAIITGASSGLGLEFAKQIEKGFVLDEIWLIARNLNALESLGKSFKRAQAKCLAYDLSLKESIEKIAEELRKQNPNVRLLVNNAGFGKIGNFADLNKAEQLRMIDVNVLALTDLTQTTLPYMQKNSAILQVASTIGFVPSPYFAVYAATKAYVVNFSLALYYELKAKHIHVMAVCPGPVATNFFNVARSKNEGKSTPFNKILSAKANAVVTTALTDLQRKRIISIHGLLNKLLTHLSRILPYSLLMMVLSRRKN